MKKLVALVAATLALSACGSITDSGEAAGSVQLAKSIDGDASLPVLFDQSSAWWGSGYHYHKDPGHFAVDFVIPAGASWNVERFQLTGDLAGPVLSFSFRANNAGQPGALIQSFSLAPAQRSIPVCCELHENLAFDLGAPLVLTGGTYWISVNVGNTALHWQGTLPEFPLVGSKAKWSTDGEATWNDIESTFDLDLSFMLFGRTTVQIATDDLQTTLDGFGLEPGILNSFSTKLRAALAAIAAGDTAGACVALQSFINHVNAQAGKKLTQAQAATLRTEATAIRLLLGC
jgi:hypothetical protein